jgi:hypothetical protein
MANEITVYAALQVKKGNTQYQSRPSSFRADMDGIGGPSPGAIQVPVSGIDVDFSQLDTPGWCRIQNLDATNFVEYGVKDTLGGVFYPIGELEPGDCTVLRLSRNLGQSYATTGTGTGTEINTLHFKADTDTVKVLVEAFER